MFTPYLLIMTAFAGANELIDPSPHATIESCEAELIRMRTAVETEWASHVIVRMSGECRDYNPTSWKFEAGRTTLSSPGS